MGTNEDVIAAKEAIARARIIVQQIGFGNLLPISGGRWIATKSGVELPCGSGYHVRIELTPADTYTVTRVFKRAGKEFIKGERKDVYCEEIGQIAYYASCFNSYDENEWVTK